MGRTDDVINVAGHRLSTGSIEDVLASHPDVAECAVIGVARPAQGPTAASGSSCSRVAWIDPEALPSELVAAVRRDIGPVAAFSSMSVVKRLPKTRSGKILRGTMKKIADGDTLECRPRSTTRPSSTRSP